MHPSPEIIIADSSSIIILHETGLLHLLQKLYMNVTITSPVAKEIRISIPDWIKIADPSDDKIFLRLLKELDEGEASSIALAAEHKNSLLIIDERDGRKIAISLHIRIIGTLAMLLEAKKNNFIPSFTECLNKLMTQGFRVSHQLVNRFLKEAGEQ